MEASIRPRPPPVYPWYRTGCPCHRQRLRPAQGYLARPPIRLPTFGGPDCATAVTQRRAVQRLPRMSPPVSNTTIPSSSVFSPSAPLQGALRQYASLSTNVSVPSSMTITTSGGAAVLPRRGPAARSSVNRNFAPSARRVSSVTPYTPSASTLWPCRRISVGLLPSGACDDGLERRTATIRSTCTPRSPRISA